MEVGEGRRQGWPQEVDHLGHGLERCVYFYSGWCEVSSSHHAATMVSLLPSGPKPASHGLKCLYLSISSGKPILPGVLSQRQEGNTKRLLQSAVTSLPDTSATETGKLIYWFMSFSCSVSVQVHITSSMVTQSNFHVCSWTIIPHICLRINCFLIFPEIESSLEYWGLNMGLCVCLGKCCTTELHHSQCPHSYFRSIVVTTFSALSPCSFGFLWWRTVLAAVRGGTI